MNGAFSIAAVSSADIDRVMAVMTDAFDPAFGEAWNAGQCLGILGLPGVWMLLADRDGVPAGFALSRIVVDEAELLLLAVRHASRRLGIASALLERTKSDAASRGASKLHLEVRDGNEALALYRAQGFTQIGCRPGYYRGATGQSFDALSLATSLR